MLRLVKRLPLYLLLSLFTVYTLGPLIWVASSSLKPTAQIIDDPFGPPQEIFFGNYRTLFESDFWTYYGNSLIVVAGGLLGIAVFGTTLAYGLSCFRFWGRDVLTSIVFGAVLLPPALVVIPLFRQMQTYGLLDSHFGLMLVYTAFALPMTVYILRAFFVRIPSDLGDAARIDGASEWQVFRRIMLPMAKPAVTTVLLLWFVFLFNEFILSLVLLQTNDNRTLPVGLTLLNAEYRVNVGALSAALIMSAIPLLTVFTIFSDRFIRGMTAGAVKG